MYLFSEEPTIGHGHYPSGLIFRQAFATPGGIKTHKNVRCARTKPSKCLRTLIPPSPFPLNACQASYHSGTHHLVLTSIPLGMSPVALLKLPQKPLLEIWYQGVNEAE